MTKSVRSVRSTPSRGAPAAAQTSTAADTAQANRAGADRHVRPARKGPGIGHRTDHDFQAVGTLTTSIDGTAYSQPANGS
ncbi:hypothetical protein [Streptomyces sp. NL15-2K]|uniref:hypothetical protein n=1 Tax=Streptomyces sp. NL15-2K TaxID=376149 RepID=UPI000F561514|nr:MULTISPECIES: hypothetical protein [Actinomycetes]WKX12238.1 hypothetical protein Q4V64_33840 [Kutzneria buriramensis]